MFIAIPTTLVNTSDIALMVRRWSVNVFLCIAYLVMADIMILWPLYMYTWLASVNLPHHAGLQWVIILQMRLEVQSRLPCTSKSMPLLHTTWCLTIVNFINSVVPITHQNKTNNKTNGNGDSLLTRPNFPMQVILIRLMVRRVATKICT